MGCSTGNYTYGDYADYPYEPYEDEEDEAAG